MKEGKIKAREGDVIAVPLVGGGYGIGLVARKKNRIMLGYFFNKIYQRIPIDLPASDLNSENIILIRIFSSLGIEEGSWPILKTPLVYNREEWPMPVFKMQEPLTGRFYAVAYDEVTVSEKTRYVISKEEADRLYEDGLAGYFALERRLTRLLKGNV